MARGDTRRIIQVSGEPTTAKINEALRQVSRALRRLEGRTGTVVFRAPVDIQSDEPTLLELTPTSGYGKGAIVAWDTPTNQSLWFVRGATLDENGVWTATDTTFSALALEDDGSVAVYGDTDLTDGSEFTPTEGFSFDPSSGFSPSADATFDLGEITTPRRWRNIYQKGTFQSWNNDDLTNYERLAMYWTGNEFWIETQQSGTGVLRDLYLNAAALHFETGGVTRWNLTDSAFSPQSGSATDIGIDGSKPVRNIFVDGQYMYNAWSGPTFYERVRLYWTANEFTIISESAGAGTTRNISIDAPTLYIQQDMQFQGTNKGLPHASFYGNDIAWVQATATQNVWYEVSDSDIQTGSGGINNFTHDGNGKLTAQVAGGYIIMYEADVESSVANKTIESAISVNTGTIINDGQAHIDFPSANKALSLAGHAHITLAANDTIELALRTTDTGTPDITVDNINLVMFQIGGP